MAAFGVRCGPQTAVAVEASTPTWHFADALRDQVGSLVIVDALKTRLKAGYAAKTDRLDAQRLADALRRDSVTTIYYPSQAIRELRELCRSRHSLVQARTAMTQRVRAVLLRQGIGDAPARLRRTTDLAWLRAVVLPPRAQDSVRRLTDVLEQLECQVRAVEQEVQAEAARDPVVGALTTVPGIGPVLGLLIRAEIGSLARFPTPAHLASYAGLVPRVEMTGGRARYGRITRRGSPWLRWALVEAAIHGTRRPDATGRWARRLAVRKGALKARVAIARHLCTDIFHAWPRATP
jgi:transposase